MNISLKQAVARAVALNNASFPVNSSHAMKKLMLNVSLEVIAGIFEVDTRHPDVLPYYHIGKP